MAHNDTYDDVNIVYNDCHIDAESHDVTVGNDTRTVDSLTVYFTDPHGHETNVDLHTLIQVYVATRWQRR